MSEAKLSPQAGLHTTLEDVARKSALAENSAATAEEYCVYNQTRERFVATRVEAVDAFSGRSEMRLRSLQPGAGTGLWILPCQTISATSMRFPLDLVYLDNDCAVLATIESFPLAGLTELTRDAMSLLVLPEFTVTEGEIHVGDRLTIYAPEEMKRHLQSMKEAKVEARETLSPYLEHFAVPPAKEHIGPVVEEPAPSRAAPEPGAPVESVPASPEIVGAKMPAMGELSPSSQSETQSWKKVGSRNWFARLLLGDPVDPRIASRETLPGLIAYFFTGGTPVGNGVRDISTTGMFVVTEERWYPGTVVRITLTDRHNPTIERSITVNAKAVRWGGDGVGLEFVMEGTKRRKSLNTDRMERANGMDPAQIKEFLRLYKKRAPQE